MVKSNLDPSERRKKKSADNRAGSSRAPRNSDDGSADPPSPAAPWRSPSRSPQPALAPPAPPAPDREADVAAGREQLRAAAAALAGARGAGETLSAVRAARRLLSTADQQVGLALVREATATEAARGMLRRVAELAADGAQAAELRYECAWLMTNVAGAEAADVAALIAAGALPALVGLLGAQEPLLCEQAAWCLGNVLGDTAESKAATVAAGAVEPLVALAARGAAGGEATEQAVWALKNLCEHCPAAADVAPRVVPVFLELSRAAGHGQVATNAVLGVSSLVDLDIDGVFPMLPRDFLECIAGYIAGATDQRLRLVSLRLMGSVFSGNTEQTQAAIDAGGVVAMYSALTDRDKETQKSALWALSNVTAGTPEQIQVFLDANLLEPTCRLCSESPFLVIKAEASWVLSNAIEGADEHQLRLIALPATTALCRGLHRFGSTAKEARTINQILDSFRTVVRASQGSEDPDLAEAANLAAQAAQELANNHANEQVRERAGQVLSLVGGDSSDED
eukprot:m51a1_g2931 putative importin subunit alpha-3 (512) ;mRNA; r:576410-578078